MHAITLDSPAPLAEKPLRWREVPTPTPGPGQLLIEVTSCGVCHSNLHVIEGDWAANGIPAVSPITPGHEVTGTVAATGDGAEGFAVGDPVGVQPLWWTCEHCAYCASGRENLCHQRRITGEHVNGGYAEYMLSYAAHTYHVPDGLDLVEAAPLFCPGVTAFAAVEKLDIGPGKTVGVFGLGGVGHMVVQFARLTGADVVAVSRNADHLAVARELGASRTVDTTAEDPAEALAGSLDAAITFAPSDTVTARALRALRWGGTLVAGVPLSVQGFPFDKEQVIKTTVIGTRAHMNAVLALAADGKVRTVVDRFPLSEAAEALAMLASGRLRSRAVLEARSL
ncbi:alcohol dehydrogenase catalytic domain-containing protein [Streptomyces sp. AV19]|uniref:alcohol dehydrogenase catalytic domain-containing protein n=1 Tax=Streptomyces sp. AV19 TaxID=2793068 RepID=UPI0018FED702|nr:alcohol dehydrogenase catalytic domain-containing protein [Streptomyces sp. AV19]MBH1934379.1 alcohol dehydrogenase catalytic domain-containing protein [Streptomyces sp. AV19]MDG4536229.1 alcohol dehydrogenase catalytic domain-containing protein [Streptomyces sp. AV19]